MKKLTAVFLFVAAILTAPLASAQWFTNGIQTNPTANQIVADTGAVGDGAGHDFDVYVSSTVAVAIVVEWRNAANDANVLAYIIPVPANGFAYWTSRGALAFQGNERVRLRMNSGVTGSVQGAINFF